MNIVSRERTSLGLRDCRKLVYMIIALLLVPLSGNEQVWGSENACSHAGHYAGHYAGQNPGQNPGQYPGQHAGQYAGQYAGEPVGEHAREHLGDALMVLKSVNSQDPYLPDQIEFINGLLRFRLPVTVLTEVEEGPLFDPDSQEIWMPGSFADVIESHFGQRPAPVADVYMHTLVHEVGHVLYSQYDLPLLSREEDAADAMASVLLLEYAPDGAEVVLNAAEMFGLESRHTSSLEEPDFWSEHSLDIQRYYTTLCHVYGSDPAARAELIDEANGLSQERAHKCVQEYSRIRQGWLSVLKPYLKR